MAILNDNLSFEEKNKELHKTCDFIVRSFVKFFSCSPVRFFVKFERKQKKRRNGEREKN